MTREQSDYTFIESIEQLEQMRRENADVPWISFDTEFVGEKRYYTRICLIQIASKRGVYIIDSQKINDLSPVFALLQDESILKITHAGDNDYRLFYAHHGILPRNVVDTQIAAGFLGYKHPVSFKKLIENELKIHLKKGYTVANWESRPLQSKQIQYALQDVIYLRDLWGKMKEKLERGKRLEWVLEECQNLQKGNYYLTHPDSEVLKNQFVKNLPIKSQVFFLRIHRWRREEAKRLDYSREMVLAGKLINQIVRTIGGGVDALNHNRRIPRNLMNKLGAKLVEMYDKKPTEEELDILKLIPEDFTQNPRQDLLTEMLDLLIKYKCLDNQIAHDIVLPRSIIKRMKTDASYMDEQLLHGWRNEFLGKELIHWLKQRSDLVLDFSNGVLKLELEQEILK